MQRKKDRKKVRQVERHRVTCSERLTHTDCQTGTERVRQVERE